MIDIEGPLGSCSSAYWLIVGVHIGARALLDINLIWFDYIARLSQRGGEGYFTRSNYFYLPSRLLEEGEGGQHPVHAPRKLLRHWDS